MRHFLAFLTSDDFDLWPSKLKIGTPVTGTAAVGNVHILFWFLYVRFLRATACNASRILISHRPGVRPSVRPSGTLCDCIKKAQAGIKKF